MGKDMNVGTIMKKVIISGYLSSRIITRSKISGEETRQHELDWSKSVM